MEILRAAKPSLDLFEAAALGEDARVAEFLDAEPYRVSGLSAGRVLAAPPRGVLRAPLNPRSCCSIATRT